jgi:ABC-type antimicrobial peptide transport system permease subunit
MLGVYGVISYSMSQRVQEIGIRMALGARRLTVILLILRQAFLPVFTGIAIGLIFFYAFARYGIDLLPGISGPDYTILWIVPAGLLLTSILAILIPAGRATRIDPVLALRTE